MMKYRILVGNSKEETSGNFVDIEST